MRAGGETGAPEAKSEEKCYLCVFSFHFWSTEVCLLYILYTTNERTTFIFACVSISHALRVPVRPTNSVICKI